MIKLIITDANMDRIVIGLGGNALLSPNSSQSLGAELGSIRKIAHALEGLAKHYNIVITHGNGTQVGDELLKNINSNAALPLYMLNAETQASIGSGLEMALNSSITKRRFCTIVTHVIVDRKDRAFNAPSKPIGPFYTKAQLEKELKNEKFNYIEKDGMFRRVVPSPMPKNVVEMDMIKHMLDRYNVICGGGGGIPIIKNGNRYIGINAVIDKDFTTQLIANALHAKRLIILTNVNYVYKNIYDKSTYINKIRAGALKSMLADFDEGTIRPKVQACIRFIENGGTMAQIGSLGRLESIINMESGTIITR